MKIAKDYFSKQSDFYAKYRPTYPEELFKHLVTLCSEKELAWDCATGNGQAAVSLSNYFKKVIATDFSANQLGNAVQKQNIIYKNEKAEEPSIESNTVDLVTVATAVHWFNIPKFYEQVDRVLKPKGVLAVWSYGGCSVSPELDKVLDYFNFEFLDGYWPPETWMNWKDKYRSLPFPYSLMETPKFIASREYNFDDLLNYIFSWSGTQQYIKKEGKNPIDLISDKLKVAWGNPAECRLVSWDIFVKCGLKP
jgi:ubiquinone/menaquinone biosynthesis C-methylase UbiE